MYEPDITLPAESRRLADRIRVSEVEGWPLDVPSGPIHGPAQNPCSVLTVTDIGCHVGRAAECLVDKYRGQVAGDFSPILGVGDDSSRAGIVESHEGTGRKVFDNRQSRDESIVCGIDHYPCHGVITGPEVGGAGGAGGV